MFAQAFRFFSDYSVFEALTKFNVRTLCITDLYTKILVRMELKFIKWELSLS